MNMRHRNVGLCIVFSIITCGIYGLYWFVCLTDDSNECTAGAAPAAAWRCF